MERNHSSIVTELQDELQKERTNLKHLRNYYANAAVKVDKVGVPGKYVRAMLTYRLSFVCNIAFRCRVCEARFRYEG